VVEEIVVVSAPQTRKQIKTAKARALITITGEDLSASLLVNPGFFTKESQARVKVSARVQVLKSKGAVFNEQLISDDTASVTIGRCLDAYKTVTTASTKVLGQLLAQIGNSVGKSLSSRK